MGQNTKNVGGLVDDPGTCGAYGVQYIPHKVVID
eukprot:SAG31_NODE_41157_length_277_cov_0.870787_1_plen_33_part_10